MNGIRYFQVEEDDLNPGRFRVVFWISCYAQNFGEDAYPEALSRFFDVGDTSFLILAKDEDGEYLEDLEYNEAKDIAADLENRFAEIIEECENIPDWTIFPEELEFDADDVLYRK